MTSRMTVGMTILTIGLAVAALAGIPALVENRSVGDVVVVCGLAVAVTGAVLMISAIPGQRRSRDELRRGQQADIEALKIKRRRIQDQKRSVELQLQNFDSASLLRSTLIRQGDPLEAATNRRALEVELISLKAELDMNGNDLKRLGVDIPVR